ncbi:PLP-dependent aminotransferase family protein [Methylobacterium frigidaeris]|uniref:8-amino-7-oxononanoate synthase n=1 Tax=Methylobacterium frigidaeris TaxID=2038277 RepID=A0AA37HAU9_9HYPH|nr:PLP-dependent aminotransferase family protein [Methylobacterium frigidaeris]PIK68810.1 GntR family transcriptional regulator [Methylobacterium frigidaeris]GJD62402.1 HTH-type transcriptional regulatory protein GabR [Methylobacterium frigidaeris]
MDGRSPRPLPVSAQIGTDLKAQIAQGVYPPGAALPSTRALAVELGVSRTTVTAAYDQLIAEGYLETRPGARARVAAGLRAGQAPAAAAPMPPHHLSAFGRRLLAEPAPAAAPGPAIDFRYGDLSGDDFPVLAWRRALSAVLLRRPARLGYGDPRGLPELRAALQAYLWRARGLSCSLDQIVVVNGSQQGIDLCARLLVDPGDRVVMEDPGYGAARRVFAAAGAAIQPVPVDAEGLQTGRLAGIGPARLAYVTPSHQFPLGGVLSAARRQALLAWAEACGATVVEDDYDGEYRFDARPVEALLSLDRAGRVVYVGTVSKTLSPQLRLGYLVVPPALSDAFTEAKRLADRQAPGLEQAALAGLLAGGGYERHLRQARRRNAGRRAALLAALADSFGGQVRVEGAAAGLHLVAWFDRVPAAAEIEMAAAARAAGVGIYPVGPLYHDAQARPDRAGLLLGFAGSEPDTIRAGIRRLAAALTTGASAGS